MPATQLPDRGVVLVSGDDAQSFLQNIVTCDVDQLPPGEARLSALLTPQGKILFDFLVSHAHAGASPSPALPGYFLDCRRAILPDLLKRLGLYKLRAKVLIAEASVEGKPLAVVAMWGGRAEAADRAQSTRDGRHPALGDRLIVDPAEAAAFGEPVPEAYHGHRISLGIPEGGLDYSFGDAFPHDADMDDLGGVAFDKGCYIGQEVVSRMQHRGTARRRIVIAHSDAVLPPQGTPVNAGERALGTLGSSVGREGLVLVRLDRAREAMDAGVPIVAAEARLTLELPSWARFGWPTATTVADA